MSNKKSKKYTYAFKEEAVRLTGLPGKSAASVARELGVPAWKLRNWIKESNEKLGRSWEMDEVLKLQKEIKELKEENEIWPRRTLQGPCRKVRLH
ncbi:MAG: transposase [Candidatus Obscuribacterales bacterium]|nr:transposase [Cyanobacteria bacterium HKST-UBA01]MCB9467513.1 transposase [Candidatus Obscuribacterales bacterium]